MIQNFQFPHARSFAVFYFIDEFIVALELLADIAPHLPESFNSVLLLFKLIKLDQILHFNKVYVQVLRILIDYFKRGLNELGEDLVHR